MKVDQFEPFISRLSMGVRLRVLGLPEVHAVRPLMKMLTVRSAVGLPRGSPVSGEVSTENCCSATGGRPFRVAPRECDFANLCPVKFHAPSPVEARDKQVAGKIQEREITTAAAAAQDKTEAASSTSAPAIPHADVTKSAQLSSDAQPRPTRKPLVTCSSQPVPNFMHNAPLTENDDRNACSNCSARCFHFW